MKYTTQQRTLLRKGIINCLRSSDYDIALKKFTKGKLLVDVLTASVNHDSDIKTLLHWRYCEGLQARVIAGRLGITPRSADARVSQGICDIIDSMAPGLASAIIKVEMERRGNNK